MRFYGLILILALGLRVWGLGLNPVGITHDEIHDLINAKSLAILGQSAPGTAAGVITQNPMCHGNCIFGELASYLLVPWMKIFPLGMIVSKIPFLLAALGIVYFGGKIFENLTNKKTIGYLTSLLLAINPWAIHFGRTAFENLFSFAFFLWAIQIFTKKKVEKKSLIWATVLAFFGFLAYFGAKPVFVFIVIWGIFYYWLNDGFKNIRLGIALMAVAAIITMAYLLILKSSVGGKRFEEISTKGSVNIAEMVNEQRRMSLEIPLSRDVFVNKHLVNAKIFFDKFLGTFNPVYLFSEGEKGYDVFMISNHPYMYLIDGAMVILGLIYLGSLGGKGLMILPLGIISTIPSVISISGVTYGLRSGLLFPLLCGLSAMGIFYAYFNLKNFWRKTFVVVIVGAYLISGTYFIFMYTFRTPFERSSGWFFHERALVKYLSLFRENLTEKIQLTVKDPVDVMYDYAFYTGKYNNKEFIKTFNEAIRTEKYEIDGISFLDKCPIGVEKNIDHIWEREMNCVQEPNMLSRISEPRDGGARFFIPEEKLCQGIEMRSYPYPRKIEDFSVEKMDKDTFCKMWVSQPKI